MKISNSKEPLILLLGDLFCFILGLYLSLLIRYAGTVPDVAFVVFLTTWSVLFLTSVISFFVAGLYEKHTLMFERRLPGLLLKAQIGNALIAIPVFYLLLPLFGVAPKTLLFIYLVTSSVLVFLWRLYGRKLFSHRNRSHAILLGEGGEFKELATEVNGNSRYPFIFDSVVDLSQTKGEEAVALILKSLSSSEISLVVSPLEHPNLKTLTPHVRSFSSGGALLMDFGDVYEDVFDRVPLSVLSYGRFLQDISLSPRFLYDTYRRLMDVFLAALLGGISLIFYPFVYILIKLDDGGPIFFYQQRLGRNNKIIEIVKFRSMNTEGLKVTRIGGFLRTTRIDELPQLWNVLSGSLSLIGPRPELPVLASEYEREIPYYPLRHLVKPGLSGWAQIYHHAHPHHQSNVSETKMKLSYDLYYLKHRSFFLDIKIALRTIQTLLSRSGI